MDNLVVTRYSVPIPGGIENVFYVYLKGAVRGCLRYDKQERQWILMRFIPLDEDTRKKLLFARE